MVGIADGADTRPRGGDPPAPPHEPAPATDGAPPTTTATPKRSGAEPQERYVLLALTRGKTTTPYHAALEPRPGDIATG